MDKIPLSACVQVLWVCGMASGIFAEGCTLGYLCDHDGQRRRARKMPATRFVSNLATTGSFVLTHPRELRRVPTWLRERKAGTLDLRRPWWPYDMVDFVAEILPANARVFEYGGGGSSIWLSDRGARLTVVEHDMDWSRRLRYVLPSEVELLEAPPTASGTITSSRRTGFFDDYVKAIDGYPDGSFDLVIVDGRARVDCVVRAKSKVRDGGYLLLDDSDRRHYGSAHAEMSSWKEKSISGLKVGSGIPSTTTIWRKPPRALTSDL